MNSDEKGLTVGELTMAVGALIIVALIWSTVNSQKDSESKSALTDMHREETIIKTWS